MRLDERKHKVRCEACGESPVYTYSRLKQGKCRDCGEPLQGCNYDEAMQLFKARHGYLILAGRRRRG
jgi:ribosomal protein L37AE/L43A